MKANLLGGLNVWNDFVSYIKPNLLQIKDDFEMGLNDSVSHLSAQRSFVPRSFESTAGKRMNLSNYQTLMAFDWWVQNEFLALIYLLMNYLQRGTSAYKSHIRNEPVCSSQKSNNNKNVTIPKRNWQHSFISVEEEALVFKQLLDQHNLF